MRLSRIGHGVVFSDSGILFLLAVSRILLHTLTNGQYGFHRSNGPHGWFPDQSTLEKRQSRDRPAVDGRVALLFQGAQGKAVPPAGVDVCRPFADPDRGRHAARIC